MTLSFPPLCICSSCFSFGFDASNLRLTYPTVLLGSKRPSATIQNGLNLVRLEISVTQMSCFFVFTLTEYKTSNYFETNLVLADSGATPDVKRSQMMAASSEADLVVTDRRLTESDWLTCFAAKIGLSRMSLLFVLLMFFIVILWLCISSMTTSTKLSDIPTQVAVPFISFIKKTFVLFYLNYFYNC